MLEVLDMFGKKNKGKEEAVEFKGGKIKNLLEKVSFIDNLDCDGEADEKVDIIEARKNLSALKAEIRSCMGTWEKDSALETALKDVIAVLGHICGTSKAKLGEDELSYGFMGRLQGIFFVENHISSHCTEKYEDALIYFEKVKKSVENALAFEKRTRSGLAYDAIGNAEAIAKTVRNIDRKMRQLEILDAIIDDVKGRCGEDKEETAIVDCDEKAEAQREEIGMQAVGQAEEGRPMEELIEPRPIEIPGGGMGKSPSGRLSAIPKDLEEGDGEEIYTVEPSETGETKCPEEPERPWEEAAQEEPEKIEIPEDEEETQQKTGPAETAKKEKPGHMPGKAKIPFLHHLLFQKETSMDNPREAGENEGVLFQKAGEKRIPCKECRKILYAPGLLCFMDKDGKLYLGEESYIKGKTYENTKGNAVLFAEGEAGQELFDLLTLTYDPLLVDVDEETLAKSYQTMEWVYGNYPSLTGEKLPVRSYMEYKAYYNQCVKDYLQYKRKERERHMKAAFLSDEISRFLILFGKEKGTARELSHRYIPLILSGDTGQLLLAYEEMKKDDIVDEGLKEHLTKLLGYAGDIGSFRFSFWFKEEGDETGEALPALVPTFKDSYGDTVLNGTVIEERTPPEAKNVRLLLKKESVSGAYTVDSVSPANMSYLVKEFYITMSYAKELGISYNGENIFLICYDNEGRRPMTAMNKYEKHMKRYDTGGIRDVISYYENRYMQLLLAYAGYNN